MSSRGHVLVVEDEEDILDVLRYHLAREGYEVAAALTGEEGLLLARRAPPDLVVLDLMLPGIDGLEVCRQLKAGGGGPAVLMLTAKSEEADIVSGLEVGADDYVTKPFSGRVLIARVRALLRRRAAPAGEEGFLRLDVLALHPGRREASVAGQPIDLTRSEFDLLLLLSRRPGWVLRREQIVRSLHGEDYPVTERAVDVLVAGLRKKLGVAARLVQTVRGSGYRLRDGEV